MGGGLQTASDLISAGLIVGRMAHSRLSALTGHCDALLTEPLPSGMSHSGSHLTVTAETFGALPFASMIPTLQSLGLRKHPKVRLNDLCVTEPRWTVAYPGQPSLDSFLASSAVIAGRMAC